MDIHDKFIRYMCGETNNDVSYSASTDNDKYVDSLKYRNEIEAFARLKGTSIPDLYNTEINEKVTAALGEVYPDNFDADLSIENPGGRFNELLSKIESDTDLVMKIDNPTFDDVIKQNSHLSWDAYFMNIAILTSLRSKDENTKVGCIIVDSKNRIVGTGYNGLPSHIDESQFPTGRDGELHNTKYAYVIHAEANALCNSPVYDLTGSRIYCTLFPCCHCAALLLQKGISEIVYLSDKHHDDPPYIASRKLFNAAGVTVRQYNDTILL